MELNTREVCPQTKSVVSSFEENRIGNNSFESCSDIKNYFSDARERNIPLKEQVLNTVACAVENVCQGLCTCYPKCENDLIAEIMRFMRTACAKSPDNQSALLKNDRLLENCNKLMLRLIETDESQTEIDESFYLVLRCSLQFYGNLVVENSLGKNLVWNSIGKKMFALLSHTDAKVSQYTAMVFYNCLTEVSTDLSKTDFGDLFLQFLKRFRCSDCEWTLFTIEMLILHQHFPEKFSKLEKCDKFIILDIVLTMVDGYKTENDTENQLQEFFKFLVNEFIKSVQTCLTVSQNSPNSNPVEVIKILKVLGEASIQPNLNLELKNNNLLLETALVALRSVQELGKIETSVFAPVYNLSSVADPQELEKNPAFGFKKELIKLIGNLCHQCRENQDLTRKLDGIPLILDCCKLDAKNPFILQWCIFAIHNLLENNPDNQAYLADITITNEVADSELLKELRLKATVTDGKVKLSKMSES